MTKKMIESAVKTIAAATVAVGISMAPAQANVSVVDLSDKTAEEQALLIAAQSNGRIAIMVRSDDEGLRDLAKNAAIYFAMEFEKQTGQEIDVGVSFANSPEGLNANDGDIDVYADSLPTEYGFIFRDFNGHDEDKAQLGRKILDGMFSAYQVYIVPMQKASQGID